MKWVECTLSMTKVLFFDFWARISVVSIPTAYDKIWLSLESPTYMHDGFICVLMLLK